MKKIPFSAERVCVCSRRVQTRAVSLRTEIRFFRLRSQFTVWVRAGGGGRPGSHGDSWFLRQGSQFSQFSQLQVDTSRGRGSWGGTTRAGRITRRSPLLVRRPPIQRHCGLLFLPGHLSLLSSPLLRSPCPSPGSRGSCPGSS